jgi:hypothetical protein
MAPGRGTRHIGVALRSPEVTLSGEASQGWKQVVEHPVLRLVLYYGGLALATLFLLRVLPPGPRALLDSSIAALSGGEGFALPSDARVFGLEPGADAPSTSPTAVAAVAMLAAVLLALPVAWLYTHTRQKRGYRQSVVQSLILLPLVVAGVVVLVKHSLALAFSLAGIVAAVRFRHNLEDSKDAIYVFLVSGIGIAAGVNLGVAVALSIGFNIVAAALWSVDFGRAPAEAGGAAAERKLRRAQELVNRTGTFIAKVDEELLATMSPDQLDALADRAWRRRKRDAPDVETKRSDRMGTLLRVRTEDVNGTKVAIEEVLDGVLQRWRYGSTLHDPDGTHVLEYTVQFRKNTDRDETLRLLRERVGSHILGVEVV